MAQTANEIIQDRIIRHSVYLERLKGGTVREVLELLTATDRDLRAVLRQRLGDIADGRTLSIFETQRIENLLQEIQAMRFAAYRTAGRKLTTDLEALGSYEVDWQARMLQESVPVQLNIGTTVALQQVAEIVNSRPFQGLILRDWVADLSAKELGRVRQAINIGMVEGLGIEDIVNRVAGSRSGHIKGVIGISRDHATTWVRTAVSHTANEARDELYAANTDVIQGVVWNSTLDTRTTPDCVIRDGLKYSLPDYRPIGHSVPWRSGPGRLHPRCRSTSTPHLKSWKELGIDLKDAPPGTRASMNGQVPGKTTYRDWIARQPAAVQDDVLGRVRGLALRRGDLSVADLFDDRGRWLTLAEIREREGVF